VASGKNRASSPTGLVCARAGAIAEYAKLTEVLSSLLMRLRLPLFPVRKSFGEPESAVMAEREARPRPSCGTEGVALERYMFQSVRASLDASLRPPPRRQSQGETRVSNTSLKDIRNKSHIPGYSPFRDNEAMKNMDLEEWNRGTHFLFELGER
jgi:hypothetical protein